jgi:hypothetical protein
MSALGQKRTWRGEFAMSALPPKADIGTPPRYARRNSSGSLAMFTATRHAGDGRPSLRLLTRTLLNRPEVRIRWSNKKSVSEEMPVNRVAVNQCAQCRADIIAPEWSEHLSDHCVRNVWACEACGYQFEDTFTCRVSWRTHHRLQAAPAAWRCWP